MRLPWITPRIGHVAFALVIAACAVLPLARAPGATAAAPAAAPELPRTWDGRALRPLALSPVEHRFAARFPGHIARLTDGDSVLVLRTVSQPTRMLHPAADCYRGLGYAIREARLERDAEHRLWRCFTAERAGSTIRVCERITDAAGQAYTDTSSWYWAAAFGRSPGPWQAVTTARPL
ncbi:hypothetical protein [Rhizobacter sp. LjRoot28]|jgi:hypothetical protein|uniref:hypothetical protein n=1 Tax=Rhizobacter sp. LjRoot28 TaxID=3342309 RepID=UPI003ECC8A32